MLYLLEFVFLAGPFAAATYGFTQNALFVLGMYYGRRAILIVVKDHLA
jgi:hypothetical protein